MDLKAEEAESHATWEEVAVEGKAGGYAGKRGRDKGGGTMQIVIT